MFLKTIMTLVLSASTVFAVNAESTAISFGLSSVKVEKVKAKSGMNFSKISIEGLENDKTLGAPELPVRSWLIQGKPENIEILLKTKKEEMIENIKPFPVQAQECRCETKEKPKFQFKPRLYKQVQPPYKLTYLGAFRGVDVTRLDVHLAAYDFAKNRVVFKTEVELHHNSQEFSLGTGDYKDYLIVVPSQFDSGVKAFADWKRERGYNVHVESIKTPADLPSLSKLIKKYYDEMGTDFVILVGDETTVPMFKVDTTGSYNTPTDLKHFTMDGPEDHIPDLFYSRIVATSKEQVETQLGKSIEFEKKNLKDPSGFKKVIGVASNEGSSPSDDEYVKGIEGFFEKEMNTTSTHLFQNDKVKSNPSFLNQTLNEGAFWMTYMGHGSGTSWPSLYQAYTTSHIGKINNFGSVKPILIDVACMNGKISPSYLGAMFMKTEQLPNELFPFGTAAYYGGTVNISWHPPAKMAQGIVKEHLEKKFKHLGEALLAGQLYLAEHWNYEDDVIDNFEWYHLQGDPGMNIEFQ